MAGRTTSFWGLVFLFLLPVSMIASAQTASTDASTDNQGIWIPRDQDLRIFEVRVKQFTFKDIVAAYQFEDIVLLPLGALSELLEIAIEVRPGEASGFVIKEDRSLFLDTSREEITLRGKIEKYDPDKVHVLFDDIYVESNLLGKWMNMSFDVDLFASRIGVRSEIPLPFLQRLEREKRISLSLSRLNQDEEAYPRHYEPYQNWGVPFVDQTVRLSRRKTESGDTTYNFDYVTYATADLARLETSLYFSGNETDPTDEFRLTMGRRDPEGGLLGGMDATEYAFGNLPEPRVALINQPSSIEPGVTVSNAPLGRQSEFDRHRFIGDLLPGWEVELYRNNVLIGYQARPVNGQYDFQDVPLLLGSNYFRLEFYGPQGQTRTEETRFDLDQSQVPKGEQYYRATVTEDEIDGNRAVLQYDAGITKKLSLTTRLVSIPLDDFDERNQHVYLDVGLKTYWDKFYLTFDAINDTESGDALEFSMQARFNDVILGITETSLNDFFSEEFRPTDVQLSRRSKYRIDAAIPPGMLPRIPISFEYTRDEYAEGGGLRRLDNLISFNARGIAISNLLTYQEITDQDPIGTGSLQLSSNYSDIRLRGSVSYEMVPDNELTNLFLTADPGQIGDYQMSVGLSHTLEGNLSEFSVSANKSSGRYNLSLGARYNTDDEVTLDASLSVGFGREPRREDWSTDARMLASSGSVSSRVFIDTNQDGIYNANDEPIADIGFRVGGGMNNQRTDEDGIAFLTGLPVHQSLSITIAPETIADPSWTVALDGVSVIPRPGHTILLDFPIFISGEIDGTVYVERGDRKLGAGHVTIELVDNAGRVVRTASTAYDGFYVMDKIPFGEYRLRVSEKQLADLGQVAKTIDNLSITYESQFQSGLDFILREAMLAATEK